MNLQCEKLLMWKNEQPEHHWSERLPNCNKKKVLLSKFLFSKSWTWEDVRHLQKFSAH